MRCQKGKHTENTCNSVSEKSPIYCAPFLEEDTTSDLGRRGWSAKLTGQGAAQPRSWQCLASAIKAGQGWRASNRVDTHARGEGCCVWRPWFFLRCYSSHIAFEMTISLRWSVSYSQPWCAGSRERVAKKQKKILGDGLWKIKVSKALAGKDKVNWAVPVGWVGQ